MPYDDKTAGVALPPPPVVDLRHPPVGYSRNVYYRGMRRRAIKMGYAVREGDGWRAHSIVSGRGGIHKTYADARRAVIDAFAGENADVKYLRDIAALLS